MPDLSTLLSIIARLRDPKNGCEWDLAQTYATICPHTIEEAYEVADAIQREDFEGLKEELGDLLFQIVFYSQLGYEENKFKDELIKLQIQTNNEKFIFSVIHLIINLSICTNAKHSRFNILDT